MHGRGPDPIHIILSPHFDDAALSLGGLLAQVASEAVVVNFFGGAPREPVQTWWDTRCGFADSTAAHAARLAEDRQALATLGIPPSRVINHDLLDRQYRFSEAIPPLVPDPALQDRIEAIIAEVIAMHGDRDIRLYAPGLERGEHVHIDHWLVKRAAVAIQARVAARSPAPPALFLYQDIPYAIENLDRLSPVTRRLWHRWHLPRQDFAGLEPLFHAAQLSLAPMNIGLSRAQMRRKLRAVKCYASQVKRLYRDLPRRIREFAAGQARFYRAGARFCERVYAVCPYSRDAAD